MAKKILALLLSAALIMTVATACNEKDNDDPDRERNSTEAGDEAVDGDETLGDEYQEYEQPDYSEGLDENGYLEGINALELIGGEMFKYLGMEIPADVLEVSEEAVELADIYVEMGIIPARFRYDGIHIAVAAINGMDCVISLNFHHINKLKTKTATEIVNRMKGYNSPFICTPSEVIDDEE
jgi:hypothetical protein